MTDQRRPETASSGNALFAVFGAVALIGLLGASVNTFVRGPLTSAIKQTKTNAAKTQMQIAGQAAVMASTTGAIGANEHAKVFLTSTAHNGVLGGLSGADSICQARATAAGLQGTYKAWLSDATQSPSTRFNKLNVPYKLVNGTLVANNWADLTDGTIAAVIDKTEIGATQSTISPWTNTGIHGGIYSTSDTCSNWTSASSGLQSRIGNLTVTSSSWTNHSFQACNLGKWLYCFQQDTSTTAAVNGDCDGDSVIEPLEMRAAGAVPAPTGGGLVPAKIGISKKDPWGTEYGYCSWDYGSTTLNASCQQETPGTNLRLAGHATNKDAPVVAIISAGPDRKFTTTCRSFATADANSNGVLTDSGDLALVGKAASSDDDIIFTYTYIQAINATGGLWQLKSGAPSVATIAKAVEAQEAKFTGAGLFAKLAAISNNFLDIVSGIRLGDPAVVPTCNAANTHALRRNASSNAVEICNGTTWTNTIAFGGSGGNPFADIPPVTENKVFVTSATYTGNLGGLTGADAICQKHANAAALPGKYMAWLADATGSPATRFYQSTVPYKMVDGTVVANNWTDLTDGTVVNKITKYETGGTISGSEVWTNVNANGTATSSTSDCKLWTDTTNFINIGQKGNPLQANATAWTDWGTMHCIVPGRLYCFQQTEATAGGGGSTAGAFDSLSDAITDYANDNFYGGPGSGGTGNYAKMSWGYQNFTSSSSAYQSTAFGAEAVKLFNAGASIGFGANAMPNVTTGDQNSMMGAQAGAGLGSNDYYNTGVGYNVFSGSGAIGNTYIGSNAGKAGTDNMAFGSEALRNNTGNQNVAMGYQAGTAITTGSNNTIAGAEALKSNVSGSNNTAIGYQSMTNNMVSENTAVGQRALSTNTTGLRAVAVGAEASRYQTGNDNTAIGAEALKGVNGASSGINNTAVGYIALAGNTTGSDNTAVGIRALNANSTGSYNTAVGYLALRYLASGNNNTALGAGALRDITSGFDNVAFGAYSLKSLTSGSANTAIGYNAGTSTANMVSGHTLIGAAAIDQGNPTGPATAAGFGALSKNSGEGNTGVGSYAGRGLASGSSYNTVIGYTAGNGVGVDKLATNMTAIGSGAARDASGDNITAIGYRTLQNNTGSDNTGMGYRAMTNLVAGSNNTVIGHDAGYNMTTASHNTLAGYQAGYTNQAGDFVTAAGYQALYVNLAPANTALGYRTLYSNTNGLYNTAIGYAGLTNNSVGNFNTAVGSDALRNLNGTYSAATCTGLGAAATATDPATGHCYYTMNSSVTWSDAQAACAANGDYLAVVSSRAEQVIVNTVGDGYAAWLGANDANVPGEWRWRGGDLNGIQMWQGDVSGSPTNDLYQNWQPGGPAATTGCVRKTVTAGFWVSSTCASLRQYICEREPTYTSSYNTAIGGQSLYAATSGGQNTALGFQALNGNTTGSDNTAAGYQALSTNTTGSNNTAIGYMAGPTANNLSNTIALGNGAQVTGSNKIRVGDTSVTTISGQVAFTATSDMRVKKDIHPSDLGLDFIMGLKPVSYRLKQGNGRLDYGFLAQDIEASLDGRMTNMITRREDEMKTYQLRSADLIAPLVKALQEQDATIERLQAKIDAIKTARLTKACTKQNAEGRE